MNVVVKLYFIVPERATFLVSEAHYLDRGKFR